MSEIDEPALGGDRPAESLESPADFEARLRRLVKGQPFAVLCTQGSAQPYGSVVAVAFTEDLRHALFATAVTTRKYRLLSESDRVALVVDDRSIWADDMMRIEAVTLTGRAVEVAREDDFEGWSKILVRRHPQLHGFVRTESCALFRVDVLRYFHVERFQEVREWIPPSS
jgi:uncharacterized protein YhbP (UPF0306 family)